MLGMFPHVVTILNKVEDDDGVMYYPTIVDKALYVDIDNSKSSLTGVDTGDSVKVTIPFSVGVFGSFVDGLTYSRLSVDEKVNKWTLRKDDIIVKGIVESPISKKDLVSTYPYQMTITRVNTNDFGSLKHWFIGGA